MKKDKQALHEARKLAEPPAPLTLGAARRMFKKILAARKESETAPRKGQSA